MLESYAAGQEFASWLGQVFLFCFDFFGFVFFWGGGVAERLISQCLCWGVGNMCGQWCG